MNLRAGREWSRRHGSVDTESGLVDTEGQGEGGRGRKQHRRLHTPLCQTDGWRGAAV